MWSWVIQLYAVAKTHQIVHLDLYISLHVNYKKEKEEGESEGEEEEENSK